MIILKSQEEIAIMREAGRLVALTLEYVRNRVIAGVTTAELDAAAEEFLRKQGGIPAFKGYQGFPATLCISVNDEIIHGIPSSRRLAEGDIVGLDMGAQYQGFCGDSAITVPVGEISQEAKRLLEVTNCALHEGIKMACPGNRISDIGRAIQDTVEAAGYSIVKDFVGHGIGRRVHESPNVPNFVDHSDMRSARLKVGMTIAIEPMVNVGGDEVRIMRDNWTAKTKDGSLSAHFEHTVAITSEGPQILTLT